MGQILLPGIGKFFSQPDGTFIDEFGKKVTNARTLDALGGPPAVEVALGKQASKDFSASILATPPVGGFPSEPPQQIEPAPQFTSEVPTFDFTRQLDRGATGEDVKALQRFLNTQGFKLAESGPGSPGSETSFFGPLTEAALQRFQTKQEIVSSGTATTTGFGRLGPQTLSAVRGFKTPEITSPPVDFLSDPIDGGIVGAGVDSKPNIPVPTAGSTLDSFTNGLSAALDSKKKSLDAFFKQQREDLEKQRQSLEKSIADFTAKQEGVLETDIKPLLAGFREQLEKNERERLKVEENFFANQKSTDELDSLLTTLREDLEAARAVTGLASIRNPRIAKLQEDTAARVGIIEAVMAARNNQINVAENMIDRSIAAIAADKEDQLNYYKSVSKFYESQKDDQGKKLVAVNKEDRDFLDRQISRLESEIASDQESVDYIKSLMRDPKTADLLEQADVSLTDTEDTINRKIADETYRQSIIALDNKMELLGAERLVSQSQIAEKSEGDLSRLKDSRGFERVYFKKGGIDGERTTFDVARLIVQSNPNASETELVNLIREGTDLDVGDAQRIAREGIANRPPLTLEQIKVKLIEVLTQRKEEFSRSDAKTQAENQIKASLKLNKDQSLPDSHKKVIEEALTEVYGKKEGFFGKVGSFIGGIFGGGQQDDGELVEEIPLKNAESNAAIQFIKDNSGASDEELIQGIVANTALTEEEARKLVNESK